MLHVASATETQEDCTSVPTESLCDRRNSARHYSSDGLTGFVKGEFISH